MGRILAKKGQVDDVPKAKINKNKKVRSISKRILKLTALCHTLLELFRRVWFME